MSAPIILDWAGGLTLKGRRHFMSTGFSDGGQPICGTRSSSEFLPEIVAKAPLTDVNCGLCLTTVVQGIKILAALSGADMGRWR